MRKTFFRLLVVAAAGIFYLLIQSYAARLRQRAKDPVNFRFTEKMYYTVAGSGRKRAADGSPRSGFEGYRIVSVHLAGRFNNWAVRDREYRMAASGPGEWRIALPLPVGSHQYKYVIMLTSPGKSTRTVWVHDYMSPAQVPDGYNGRNSVRRVRSPGRQIFVFRKRMLEQFLRDQNKKRPDETVPRIVIHGVFLAGRFSDWNRELDQYRMRQDGKGGWIIPMYLPPGRHPYKFVLRISNPDNNAVSTVWCHNPFSEEKVPDGFGGLNSVLVIRTYDREIFFLSFVMLGLIGFILWFTIIEFVLRAMMRLRISLRAKLLFLFMFLIMVSNIGFLFYTYRQKVSFAARMHLNMINMLHSFLVSSGVTPWALEKKGQAGRAGTLLEGVFSNTSLRQNYLYHSNSKQLISGLFILDASGRIRAHGQESSLRQLSQTFITSNPLHRLEYYQKKCDLILAAYTNSDRYPRELFAATWSDYRVPEYPHDAAPDGATFRRNRRALLFFRYDTYLYPIYYRQRIRGYYLASSNAASIAAGFSDVFFFNLALVITALVFAFFLVGKAGGFILEPLVALSRGLDHVKEGDLEYDFRVETGDEIESLGRSYGYMRSRLLTSRKEIEKYTNHLESMVHQRTAELEAANGRLREADRLKSQFFANVSHELRTPLTLILAPLEELQQSETDPGRRRFLATIHASAVRLLRLINALLELSSIEAGKSRSVFRRVRIRELLDLYRASISSFAELHRITVSVSGDPGDVYVDPDKAEKIFMNLLSNALKYTPDGGSVGVDVVETPEAVSVTVRDSGSGIPEEDREKLFARFMQSDYRKRDRKQGTGIGLYLVRSLVALHGGEVDLVSGPDEGAAFRVTFPRGCAHLPDGDVVHEDEPASIVHVGEPALLEDVDDSMTGTVRPGGSGDERILIVEDDRELRRLLAGFLSSRYTVHEAEDGERGLAAALEFLPDLVISDVMMPGMNGYDLCRAIQKNRETRHVPVILITARVGMEERESGLATGAVDYIYKPFRKSELLYKVDTIFRLNSFRRALMQREKLSSLGLLSGGLLHEIRNPVNFILGNLSPLEEDLKRIATAGGLERSESDRLLETIRVIREGAERISNLVGHFRAFLHSGRISSERLDPGEVVRTALSVLSVARKDAAAVEVDMEGCSPVETNRERLLQILTNLIENSLDAAGGQPVRIRCRNAGETVSLIVEDGGPGVPDDVREHIFEPFMTTKAVGAGMGLGLYLARTLVEALGGTLTLGDSPLGGAAFTVNLPVTPVST